MVDITHKINTLRKAVAIAKILTSSSETMEAIQLKKVPKGDIFEFGRAAGLLAIKKTSDVIPDCHPIPIEKASITYDIQELVINIRVEVHTIYKTGVEVEAMHGASVVALTLYDMLKPIDKDLEIQSIKLEAKEGGKSDFRDQQGKDILAAVVVCSDSMAKNNELEPSQDFAGKAVIDLLKKHHVIPHHYCILADEFTAIQNKALELSELGYHLVLFVGGTGLSPRDVTPDAIIPLLDRTIPGIMEAARVFGQQRTPYAMLSRGVAGFIKNSLVLTLPGSTKGAKETMEAVFPYILHIFKVASGYRHDGLNSEKI